MLAKLRWYPLGEETSEAQWSDVLGVIRVQGEALDFSYLEEWASELDVADLLGRAMEAAKS